MHSTQLRKGKVEMRKSGRRKWEQATSVRRRQSKCIEVTTNMATGRGLKGGQPIQPTIRLLQGNDRNYVIKSYNLRLQSELGKDSTQRAKLRHREKYKHELKIIWIRVKGRKVLKKIITLQVHVRSVAVTSHF